MVYLTVEQAQENSLIYKMLGLSERVNSTKSFLHCANLQYKAIQFIENIDRDKVMVNEHTWYVKQKEQECTITNKMSTVFKASGKDRITATFNCLAWFAKHLAE